MVAWIVSGSVALVVIVGIGIVALRVLLMIGEELDGGEPEDAELDGTVGTSRR